MTNQEFDALAERILHSLLRRKYASNPVVDAIDLADSFVTKLTERRIKRRNDSELTAEEVQLIQDGRAISAIKSVRERTGMYLKDAKAFVDEARKKLDL
jgi:ribosomal protein L7/L12